MICLLAAISDGFFQLGSMPYRILRYQIIYTYTITAAGHPCAIPKEHAAFLLAYGIILDPIV
jgi:hypothetical protein